MFIRRSWAYTSIDLFHFVFVFVFFLLEQRHTDTTNTKQWKESKNKMKTRLNNNKDCCWRLHDSLEEDVAERCPQSAHCWSCIICFEVVAGVGVVFVSVCRIRSCTRELLHNFIKRAIAGTSSNIVCHRLGVTWHSFGKCSKSCEVLWDLNWQSV